MRFSPGYVALMSAIVISVLLMGLTFTVGFAGYQSRFNVLDGEFKEASKSLAEACAETALTQLALDPSFTGPLNVPVGSDSCDIVSAAPDVPVPGQTTILTLASKNSATTNISLTVDSAALTIISWNELP